METNRMNLYRREPWNSGKLKVTASSRVGVESNWKRDPQSVTAMVNLIRPFRSASPRGSGEAKFLQLGRREDDLTSHGKGVRLRARGWLRMECEIGVFMCKWGNLARLVWGRTGTRAVMVAQASRGAIAGERPPTPERRRVMIAGAKGGRKVKTGKP